MTQIKAARHPDVSNDRHRDSDSSSSRGRRPSRKKKTPSTYSYHPTPGRLLQRGNYSLLRLLTIINAAGSKGITTLTLLDELGSRADRINAIIREAEKLELIERKEGESEHGQFPPVYNMITEKGKELLLSQLKTRIE